MRFTRIAFQWLVIALMVAGIGWAIFIRKNLPDYGRATWSQRDGFFAISFKGMAPDAVRNYQFLLSQVVTRFKDWMNGTQGGQYKKEIISDQRLAALMEAIKAQGYVPIKTQDIIAFYTKGAPLPEKGIYIMFEGGSQRQPAFRPSHSSRSRFQRGAVCVRRQDHRQQSVFPTPPGIAGCCQESILGR